MEAIVLFLELLEALGLMFCFAVGLLPLLRGKAATSSSASSAEREPSLGLALLDLEGWPAAFPEDDFPVLLLNCLAETLAFLIAVAFLMGSWLGFVLESNQNKKCFSLLLLVPALLCLLLSGPWFCFGSGRGGHHSISFHPLGWGAVVLGGKIPDGVRLTTLQPSTHTQS